MQRSSKVAVAVLAGLVVVGTSGIAAHAMSDGVYTPRDQRCSEEANDTANESTREDGCQNLTVHLDNGDWEIVRAGTLQTPEGTFVHELVVDGDFDVSQIDPTQGARVYFGADDNLDRGEHDGASGIGNGPSDGGGIHVGIDPASLQTWVDHAGDPGYLQAHPIPIVSFAMGECADGICSAVTTERRVAYQGGDEDSHRDAADYDDVRWDPESCAGPSQTSADCDDPTTAEAEDISSWNDQVGTVYVEPGVQVYEDPDPEGSPIGPYPLPGAYAGTCGVIVGGGPVPAGPDSPVTNGAGQVDARQGCE